MTSGPTSVYRYYDRHDILIYIGITGRGIGRNSEHNRRAEWWQYVARQEVEHCATREEAASRERELIGSHRPPFNNRHNPDYQNARATYLAWAGCIPARMALPPLELLKTYGGELPLAIMRWDPTSQDVLLGMSAEHHALSSRITWTRERRVHVAGHPAYVSDIEMRGQLLLIKIQPKGRLPADIHWAWARVKVISLKQPQQFRLSAIRILAAVPSPAGAA